MWKSSFCFDDRSVRAVSMSIDLPEPREPRRSRELDSPAAMVDVRSEWSVEVLGAEMGWW